MSPTPWSWLCRHRGWTKSTCHIGLRLLSDNGPKLRSVVELAAWLDKQDMPHIRGAPYHPMTQGKIERWHLTLKNRILLENCDLPGQLEARIEAFVAHYNHLRYHESIEDLTPADVYFGRGQTILLERERIKRKTIQHRRLHQETHASLKSNRMRRISLRLGCLLSQNL